MLADSGRIFVLVNRVFFEGGWHISISVLLAVASVATELEQQS